MKSEILSQEKNVIVVKAEYEAGEVDGAVGRTVRDLSSKANIKGFRKGRVPRKTLELYLGKGSIYREAIERLASQAIENVVAEYDLSLITEPKLKLGNLSEGLPLDIEFTFEVRPEVVLPDIPSLAAEKVVYSVNDGEVEEGLRQVLESNARLEPVSDDRPAEPDDIVEALYSTYSVQKDGELKELEEGKKNTIFLASVRKDIAEAIIGHKPAEELSFDIKLEDDYPDPRMAGKTVRYELEILNFMKRVVPEATDESISEISRSKYQSVGELKNELRKQLEENAATRSEATLQESALKALAEAAEVDIPESMIERQYLSMRRDQDGRLRQDLKQSLDDYLKNNSLSVEEFDGNLKKHAEEIVRNSLVLDALAERDDITFTSDEINEEIIRVAAGMRVNPQELADRIGKNQQEFAALAMRVRSRNTMKHLASLVQVTETSPPEHVHEDGHEHEGHDHEGHDNCVEDHGLAEAEAPGASS
ncbi:MAG: trigger factor [Synergistaceae bacterium]|nr:trigger factor [Synergistaceae bacterium]